MLKDLFNKSIITFNIKDVAKVFFLYQGIILLGSLAEEKRLLMKKEEK